MTERLNTEIITELLKLKPDGTLYHRESQYLEFKESFNFAGLADYYRDFAAFANNMGGYIIFGVKDRPRRELIGLSEKAIEQFDKLDPETVSGHLLELFSRDIIWEHEIFKIDELTFGVFCVHTSAMKPIICKKDDGKDNELKCGEIYYRYGGRSQKIQFAELENIINNRVEQNNRHWMDLFQKIGQTGPQNAAILDTERGLIEKSNSQILMVDEELVKRMQWIREGEFSEKKGARTLKLVGTVQPVNQIEVVKKVKENKLREYPLSATEMLHEIKKRKPEVKQNKIYEIISENGLKSNKEYSDYVFRNHRQESEYDKTGKLPKGIPSIYKHAVVDYIIKVIENEQK
jgi:predicted HTH transcriptional regulator